MFPMIQKGIEVYRKELRAYKEWFDGLEADHGKDFNPMQALDNHDWQKIQSWSEKLKGMEQVLGLTKAEVNSFESEIGMVLSK